MGQSVATTYHTYREILSQFEAWQDVIRECQAKSADLRAIWDAGTFQEVVFTGCGSTHYLARSAREIFQGRTGLPAQAYPASDLLLFPDICLPPGRARLLVAISRSGETTETLRAIERFRNRDGGPVIAITCYDERRLAQTATLALVARQAQEQSVAQTRSFAAMLLGAQCLAAILAGDPLSPEFKRLPELGAGAVEGYHDLARRLGSEASIERFFFLGSGPFYGLACEAMLKMKEMSLSYSEAYHFLEFRHGPVSMVNGNTLIAGLLSRAAFEHELALLKEMRGLGARVLAITPNEIEAGEVDYQVVLPGGLSDLERGVLYLPVLQLLAFYRALYKGLDPDQPVNLTAVVNLDI